MRTFEYIREIKRRLRDDYGFEPSRTVGDEPCFDNFPDGAYPMHVGGKLDLVLVIDGTLECCNFICEKGGLEAFQKRSIKERKNIKAPESELRA